MRNAIRNLGSVIVITQTSATQIPALVPNNSVFDQKLVVFASSEFAMLAVLTSSVHRVWATCWGSSRTGDPVYTPSDVFETFPQPPATDRLHTIGKTLDAERREIMLRRGLGLTKLYNLINDSEISDAADPEVARLRQIQVELDWAVMAAYSWDDVFLDHGFHTYRQMRRWTVSPAARMEVLDRLLAENHRRAATQGEVPPPVDGEEPEEQDK
jgi:hypothetical protein